MKSDVLGDEGAPRVFISYSHDSQLHRAKALWLAHTLRSLFVAAWLDQFEENEPPHSWPIWMYKQIAAADFVIMICSESYMRRVHDQEIPGKGRGARWEGAIITHSLYSAQNLGETSRYIPVAFTEEDLDFLPYFVAGATHYVLDRDTGSGLDRLARRILREPEVVPFPLGTPLQSVQSFEGSPDFLTFGREAEARRPQARILGAASSDVSSELPPELQQATFRAVAELAGRHGSPRDDLELLHLRQIIARFSEVLSRTRPNTHASVWDVFSGLDDEIRVRRLVGNSRWVRTEDLAEQSLNDIASFVEALEAYTHGERLGASTTVEEQAVQASWAVGEVDEGITTVYGFLTVESSLDLGQQNRLMGQEVAERLTPLFRSLRARLSDASG